MMQNTNQENATKKQVSRWHQFDSQQAINQAAVARILAAAQQAIAQYGSFLIVLAGGGTPKACMSC